MIILLEFDKSTWVVSDWLNVCRLQEQKQKYSKLIAIVINGEKPNLT